MSTHTLITAEMPDARFFNVFEASGKRIWNCWMANSFTGEVTITVTDPKGRLLVTEDVCTGEVEILRVTYRPPGGVRIVDTREEPCEAKHNPDIPPTCFEIR
jgi:hypothetical protein